MVIDRSSQLNAHDWVFTLSKCAHIGMFPSAVLLPVSLSFRCKDMKRVQELNSHLMQRINLFFCWKLGWTHMQARAALTTVYGDQILCVSRTRRWFAAFQQGRTNLVDVQRAPRTRTGRSPEAIQAVKDVLAVDKSLTVAAISNQSGVPSTSVYPILHKDLQLSLRCAKFLPNVLTPRHIVERFTHASNILHKLRATPSFLKKIVTMDEAWVYQYDPELKRNASQWLSKEEERSVQPRRTLSVKKSLLVAFFDHRGMVHFEFLRGATVGTPTFIQILTRYRTALKTCRPHLTRHLHMDNAPAHGSRDTRLHLLLTGQKVIDPPPPCCQIWLRRIIGCFHVSRSSSEARDTHPWMLWRPQ